MNWRGVSIDNGQVFFFDPKFGAVISDGFFVWISARVPFNGDNAVL
jgi:hypothetical protein